MVMRAFVGPRPIMDNVLAQVDHKDENKVNNLLSNLRYMTPRNNTARSRSGTSIYTGVCLYRDKIRWFSQITLNRKRVHLGVFDNEIEAHHAYQDALSQHIKTLSQHLRSNNQST